MVKKPGKLVTFARAEIVHRFFRDNSLAGRLARDNTLSDAAPIFHGSCMMCQRQVAETIRDSPKIRESTPPASLPDCTEE